MKNNVKIILHIDMNAFFLSCELIYKPHLKNKPIAIAGKNAIYNKGVVVTASYEARKYGVKAAMPVFKARKLCPQLQFISTNKSLYQECSHKFIEFLKKYSPLIEVASIDEAYLDVTKRCETIHPFELATQIQQRLMKELQLPSSIGIATNKFLAKMASDMKKPMGITVLRNREIKEKLWPLKIEEMFGIGKKTAPKLMEVGIKTIGDLVKKENNDKAKKILGNQFNHFYLNALGYGDNNVDPDKYSDYKSIGHSSTYTEFIRNDSKAYEKLNILTKQVTKRLQNHKYLTKTITVQIKYTDFVSHTKSKTIKQYTDSYSTIYGVVVDLFDELWNQNAIRLLGVSTSNIKESTKLNQQIDLFSYDKYQEEENMIKIINKINRKYGDNTLKKGYKIKK